MERRINRENKDPKAQKGLTPLSLLEQKKLREQRQKETQERLNK
jgi:hypothetical protein